MKKRGRSVKNKNELPATKPKYKNTGKRNRTAGQNYERQLAKEFRDLGYAYCKTSRQASRLLDDCKVDLYGIPYNVQAKNVQSGIKYKEIFDSMVELLGKNMPERLPFPNVIFHKKKGEGELVVMTKDTFYEFIKLLYGTK